MPASGGVTGVTVLAVKFLGNDRADRSALPCGVARHSCGVAAPNDRATACMTCRYSMCIFTTRPRHTDTHGRVSSRRSTPTHRPAADATSHAASTRVGAGALQHAQQLCIVPGNVADARVAAAAVADRPPATRRHSATRQHTAALASHTTAAAAARRTHNHDTDAMAVVRKRRRSPAARS